MKEKSSIPVVNENDKVEISHEKYIEYLTNEVTTNSIKKLIWISSVLITIIGGILIFFGFRYNETMKEFNGKLKAADSMIVNKVKKYDSLLIANKSMIADMQNDRDSNIALNDRLMNNYNDYMKGMFTNFIDNLKTSIELQSKTEALNENYKKQIDLSLRISSKFDSVQLSQQHAFKSFASESEQRSGDFEQKLTENVDELTNKLTGSEFLILSQKSPSGVSRISNVKITYKDKQLNDDSEIKNLTIEKRAGGKGFVLLATYDKVRKNQAIKFDADGVDYVMTLIEINSAVGELDNIILHIVREE